MDVYHDKGNLGAFVRRETQGDWEHFFLATYWKDLSSIKAKHLQVRTIISLLLIQMMKNFNYYLILMFLNILLQPLVHFNRVE